MGDGAGNSTKKSVRDTVGLHISAWPCGVVNDFVGNFKNIISISISHIRQFAELHGSESIRCVCFCFAKLLYLTVFQSQVHANLLELVGDLPPENAQNLVGVLYDDMYRILNMSIS